MTVQKKQWLITDRALFVIQQSDELTENLVCEVPVN
jgi:hypothetical protein